MESERSLQRLPEAGNEAWSNFPDELLQELADSRRRTLVTVSATDGLYTKDCEPRQIAQVLATVFFIQNMHFSWKVGVNH